jgi:HK97 family phage portal protein
MGLIDRVQASRSEERVIGGVPWRPWDSPYFRFDAGGPAHPTKAAYGEDEALRLTPLYAAVKLISEFIASMPVKIYTKTGNGKKIRYNGPSMFDDPAPDTGLMDWLYEALTSLLLHGNAWGYVLSRDGYGYPQQIQWMPPDMVTVIDEENVPYNPLRAHVYFYGREVKRDERVHIKAFSVPGRTEAISPLRAFAITIVNGLEATRYGTDWFKAGGFPPGTFKNNEIEIDPTQSAEIRSLLTTSIRRREPLVYGRDWDYHPVTVPPSEAQFLEAMQMNATQIAAVYGLPPERIGGRRGDSLTYSTVAQSALQIIEALRPWMIRLENAFSKMIPANRFTTLDADVLLKADLQERANIYRVWRDIGYMSVDEMREQDDKEPLPNGIGKDNIPLEAIVGMSRSVRAIPNSVLPQITLEAKMIAAYLEDIMAGRPPAADADVPVDVPLPDATPSGAPGGGGSQPSGSPTASAGPNGLPPAAQSKGRVGNTNDPVQQYLSNLIGTVRGYEQDEPEPEFVGPWIPGRKEMNGNGRHLPPRLTRGVHRVRHQGRPDQRVD